MASGKNFSLLGKGLKLDSAEDIAPHIQALKGDPDVEEVQFTGNTLGVGASEALAAILSTKTKLQVRLSFGIIYSF
jgi:Ran GTPase-activating protein 1